MIVEATSGQNQIVFPVIKGYNKTYRNGFKRNVSKLPKLLRLRKPQKPTFEESSRT